MADDPIQAEPQCCCLEYWKSHPPDCPRVLAGLEVAGKEPCLRDAIHAALEAVVRDEKKHRRVCSACQVDTYDERVWDACYTCRQRGLK